MKTDGGRYQFLSLAEVKGKIEVVEACLSKAIGNSYSMTAPTMLNMAQTLQEAKSIIKKLQIGVIFNSSKYNTFSCIYWSHLRNTYSFMGM